ncbi:MAG: hypothetical protein AB2556_21100, partial [Candidatus Thiodiazotropha sp.]
IGTGFAEVQEWEFAATCHPVIPAWFGKHFASEGWAPTQLLALLTESGLLKSLKVRETIIAFKKQTDVWLPEDRDQGRSIIGKFTQGAKAASGALERCHLGYVLTYYGGSQPQYAHLRASMLAYAHINLISMLSSFEPDEAVRVATDSI